MQSIHNSTSQVVEQCTNSLFGFQANYQNTGPHPEKYLHVERNHMLRINFLWLAKLIKKVKTFILLIMKIQQEQLPDFKMKYDSLIFSHDTKINQNKYKKKKKAYSSRFFPNMRKKLIFCVLNCCLTFILCKLFRKTDASCFLKVRQDS